MFIRYEINYSTLANNTTSQDLIMNDIVGILNGTYTLVSQLSDVSCNKALSRIEGGVGGATGILCDNATDPVYSNFNWSGGATGVLTFQQKHSAHLVTTGYTPLTYHFFAFDTTYGMRHRMSGNNGVAGMYPRQAYATEYWANSSSLFSGFFANNTIRLLIYVSKHWFIIQAINSSGNVGTSCSMAYEHTLEDIYAYKVSNNYASPNIAFQSYISGTVVGAAANASDVIHFGRSYYPTNDGTVYAGLPPGSYTTTPVSSPGSSTNNSLGTYFPIPAPACPMETAYADTYTGLQNKLVPFFLVSAGYSNNAPTTTVRKIKEFYRGPDDLAENGEQIVVSSTNYRAIVMHKTLNFTITSSPLITDASATRNAVYLVPEKIGGF